MDTAYSDAYIYPIIDGGGDSKNNTKSVPFVLHINTTNSITTHNALVTEGSFDSKAKRSSSYWIAYVLEAYQGLKTGDRADNDPDSEDGLGGISDGVQDHPPGNPCNKYITSIPTGSFIFTEDLRDESAEYAFSIPSEPRIVAHEIGHQCGLPDRCSNNGLMSRDLYNSTSVRFSPDDLKILRGRASGPGL